MKLSVVSKFENGKLIEYNEFYKDGTLKKRFDYTESCGDPPFHYCIYLYNKDGSLKTKTTIQTPKNSTTRNVQFHEKQHAMTSRPRIIR